jgi:hypothetical protein
MVCCTTPEAELPVSEESHEIEPIGFSLENVPEDLTGQEAGLQPFPQLDSLGFSNLSSPSDSSTIISFCAFRLR